MSERPLSDEAERSDRRPAVTPSLRDMAYGLIKHRITTCAYKPGEYLNEAFVSATLGIGRTPVHQALDRLMLEGLVDVIPRKGVIVKPISLDEVMQIIEVRTLNECHGVRLAASNASPEQIAQMTDVLTRCEQWIAARDNEQIMLLDREFHGVLAQASRNDVLAEQLGRLHDRSIRFWALSLNTPGHQKSVQTQHLAILAAIRDHDPEGAEQAMRAHIEDFRHNITRSIAPAAAGFAAAGASGSPSAGIVGTSSSAGVTGADAVADSAARAALSL